MGAVLVASCGGEDGDTERACARWRDLVTSESPSDAEARAELEDIATLYGDTEPGEVAADLVAALDDDRDLGDGFAHMADACDL